MAAVVSAPSPARGKRGVWPPKSGVARIAIARSWSSAGGLGVGVCSCFSWRWRMIRNSDVLTSCAAGYRRQVGNFLPGRAILALRNSLPYLMMGNLIRTEIRGCGDRTNRLSSEKPRLRRALSTFPGYPKLGQTPKLGSSRIVRYEIGAGELSIRARLNEMVKAARSTTVGSLFLDLGP